MYLGSLLTGGTSIVIGAAVMAMWLARPQGLPETMPLLFAMQFNTALCFLLSGAALCLLILRFHIPAAIMAAAVGLFSAATLYQHFTGAELNIDRLLIEPYTSVGTRFPGRIAPNPALCFLLVSVSILVTTVLGRMSLARIVLASLVFMISSCALLGYILSISTAQEWLSLVRMSPQTAICFFGLSVGLIFEGVSRFGYSPSVVAATLAAATYIVLLAITYVETMRQEELLTQELPAGEMTSARSTLLAVLLLSGLVYSFLVIYAFRNWEKSRRFAGELAESRKRLAAIIDTAVDGFLTMDTRGKILSVNPACERIFGYGADGMIDRPVSKLIPDFDRDKQEMIGTVQESTALRHDGTVFPIDLAVVRIDLGRQTIYSGVVRDISERKRYERDLLDANAELEEFSYRTSHDLRSPIASSIGLMTIVRDMADDGAGMREIQPVFDRIEQSFRKLDHLIQNIIILTRTKVMDEPESEIAVASLIRETAERLRYMETVRPPAIRIDIPDDLTVRKKPSRFGIIMENLLSNAIKYRDPTEAEPAIVVSGAREGSLFMLSVADNGIGIPAEEEAHLFQMFKRFHPQHAPGSGLGLYILRKSAEHLGGSVAYQRRDKGSIFTVTLPDGPSP